MAEQMTEFQKREFADRLAQARDEAGLTQDDAARAVGVTQRSWQSWEAGESIPFKRLANIADVVGRSKEWLLHGDPQEPLGQDLMAALMENNALLRRLLDERKRDAEDG
jgi:transcriptional regulator with XRE-family HTH domain